MTGYNHYPNCTCGWCVGGHRGVNLNELHREMERRSASEFLKRNGASRLGSTCFVVPNATCPLCKASVYFYSNANGSRVFFDSLGPPWPKHPCTDRPSVASRVARHALRPERRKIGTVREIIEKGWIVDRTKVPNIGSADQPNLDAWRLLLFTDLKVRGGTIEIKAEFLETFHKHNITLTTAADPAFYVGQFASLRDETLSFYDEVRDEQRDVVINYNGMKVRGVASGKDKKPKPRQTELDAHGLPKGLETEGFPGPKQRVHDISTDRASDYFTRVKQLILSAAKGGATYLADFHIVMNDSGLRTLRGARWTRELVSGVIYDIRNEGQIPRPGRSRTPAPSPKTNTGFVSRPPRQPLPKATTQELAGLNSDQVVQELGEIEGQIRQLEEAWDAALTSAQRQKARDQLEAKRRRRAALMDML
jgi:hypothetical protein